MCTMIVQQVGIEGSGKGRAGWFAVRRADVSFDHPFHAPFEHALNIDFVDPSQGLDARVAVELSRDAARALAETILKVLAEAERVELATVLGVCTGKLSAASGEDLKGSKNL